MDSLIAQKPSNPYFYQLKGQFLFESGHPTEALTAYNQTLKLAPDSEETMLLYAESAIELPASQKDIKQIIAVLNKLIIKDESPRAWALLSRAYYEDGRQAESFYAAAKYSLLIGNLEAARTQIKKAESLNPSDSLKLRLSDLKRELKHSRQP